MPENVVSRRISWAEIHDLFLVISHEFGYDAQEYEEELAELITLWDKQGFIEIYQTNTDRKYGRAKDSSLAQGASPYYIDLFHVRLTKDNNDPLVVLYFDEIKGDTIASLRFMLSHDDMFGTTYQKYDNNTMRLIRQKIDKFIQSGH